MLVVAVGGRQRMCAMGDGLWFQEEATRREKASAFGFVVFFAPKQFIRDL
jgi:hypothetical protein